MEPAGGLSFLASQSALFADTDPSGMPASDTSGATWTRRPPSFAGELLDNDATDSDAMTGTTGPRQAVRRSYESGTLMRSMNELPQAYTRAYDEAMSELRTTGKKSIPASAINKLVAEKLNIDESRAKTIVARVRESRRSVTQLARGTAKRIFSPSSGLTVGRPDGRFPDGTPVPIMRQVRARLLCCQKMRSKGISGGCEGARMNGSRELARQRRDSRRQSSRRGVARLARTLMLALVGGGLLALVFTMRQASQGDVAAAAGVWPGQATDHVGQ